MAYADQTMSGNKIVAIVIVGLIHLVVGYVLVTGLAYSAMKKAIERVTTVDIDEPEPEKTEEPPPPDEKTPPPPPIVAPPPPINIAIAPPQIETVTRPPIIPPPVVRTVPPPAPPAPPKVSHAKAAVPKNAGRWTRSIMDSYPPRASRAGTEGTVGVAVTVGPNGKVAACSVTSSSGSDILDEAACDGMRRYAQFDPALDEDGSPTNGSYSTRIVYRLQ